MKCQPPLPPHRVPGAAVCSGNAGPASRVIPTVPGGDPEAQPDQPLLPEEQPGGADAPLQIVLYSREQLNPLLKQLHAHAGRGGGSFSGFGGASSRSTWTFYAFRCCRFQTPAGQFPGFRQDSGHVVLFVYANEP